MATIVSRGQLGLTDMNDITASPTQPSNPVDGSLWWNTSDNQLYVYSVSSAKWTVSTDYQNYVQSRGENLVTNGTGLLGNNKNFSAFTFDGSDSYFSKGSFKDATYNTVRMSDEIIPVDVSKTYRFTTWAKTNPSVGAHFYIGVAEYDADGLSITGDYHMYMAGTLSTLTQDLKNGDTVVHLDNVTNWVNASTQTYQRKFIFWNYTNASGYTFPQLTYSRNTSINDLWADGSIDTVNKVVTLRSAWTGGTIVTGTKLSQGNSGGTYKYTSAGNATIPSTWTQYTGTIGGVDNTGNNDSTKFSNGTSGVKLLFLNNRDTTGGTVWYSNLSFNVDVASQSSVDAINITLGNMANDNIIDYSERQVTKDKLTGILGLVQPDATGTLPTTATLDSGAKGSFYQSRKSATNAGISTSDPNYVNLATQYNNLKTYLEGLTPIDCWDVSTANQNSNITVVKDTWRTNWLNYYQAELTLDTTTAQQLKSNVDNVSIGGRNIVLNSGFIAPTPLDKWVNWGTVTTRAVVAVSGTTATNAKEALHLVMTGSNQGVTQSLTLKSNTNYIIGFDLKVVTGTCGMQLQLYNGTTYTYTAIYQAPNTDYTRYYYSFNSGTNTSLQIQCGIGSTALTALEMYISNIKLEEGNKATAWSSAPEDLETRVTTVESATTATAIVNTVRSSASYLNDINIVIGAKNLIQNSTFNSYDTTSGVLANWTGVNALWTIQDPDTDKPNSNILHASATGNATNPIYSAYSNYFGAKNGDTFVFTIDLKVTDKVAWDIQAPFITEFYDNTNTRVQFHDTYITDMIGSPTITNATWQRISYAVTVNTSTVTQGRIRLALFKNGEIFIREVKVEKGTRPTDYTTAEKDLTDNITLLTTNLSQVQSTMTADGISTLFSQSQTYSDIMNGKANTSDLGGYATTDALNGVANGVGGQINDAITALNLGSTYATQLQLDQTSKNLTTEFSASGGMNLLKNSIGFSDLITKTVADAGTVQNWFSQGTTSRAMAIQTTALNTLGFGSGFQWSSMAITNNTSIDQYINVIPNQTYTLSWYINKSNASPSGNDDGAFRFFLYEYGQSTQIPVTYLSDSDGVTVVSDTQYKYNSERVTNGFENKYITFTPQTSKVQVRVYGHSLSSATVSGLMFTIGQVPLQWSLATGETYNTNVRLDINGIRVSQLDANSNEVGYTQITPTEFAGYYDANLDGNFEKVFYLNGDETVSKKVRALNEFTMGSVKIVKVPSANDWKSLNPYIVGDIVSYGANTYTCTIAGTSGSTPPSFTSGTATDGTVTWSFTSTSAYIGWAYVPVS